MTNMKEILKVKAQRSVANALESSLNANTQRSANALESSLNANTQRSAVNAFENSKINENKNGVNVNCKYSLAFAENGQSKNSNRNYACGTCCNNYRTFNFSWCNN
jgi:hypothetical protein